MKLFALRLRGIQRRSGTADINEGQPTRVTMSQNIYSAANESLPMPSDGFAMAHVVVGELFCCGERQRLLFADSVTGSHRAKHLVHRIHRINGGRPRSFESLINC